MLPNSSKSRARLTFCLNTLAFGPSAEWRVKKLPRNISAANDHETYDLGGQRSFYIVPLSLSAGSAHKFVSDFIFLDLVSNTVEVLFHSYFDN